MELREQKQSTDNVLKEVDKATGRVAKMGEELKEQVARNTQLLHDNTTRTAELANKNADITSVNRHCRRTRVQFVRTCSFVRTSRSRYRQLRVESKRMSELREKLQKRISDMEKKKDAVDAERDHLKLQVGR